MEISKDRSAKIKIRNFTKSTKEHRQKKYIDFIRTQKIAGTAPAGHRRNTAYVKLARYWRLSASPPVRQLRSFLSSLSSLSSRFSLLRAVRPLRSTLDSKLLHQRFEPGARAQVITNGRKIKNHTNMNFMKRT